MDAAAPDAEQRGSVLRLRRLAPQDSSLDGVPMNRTTAEWCAVVALVLWVIREAAL